MEPPAANDRKRRPRLRLHLTKGHRARPPQHRRAGLEAGAVKRAELQAEIHDGEVVNPTPTFTLSVTPTGSAPIAAGWDIEEVSARLGHKDTGVTQRMYIHAYESAQRSAARAERLEATYGSVLGNSVETVNGSGETRPEAGGPDSHVTGGTSRQSAVDRSGAGTIHTREVAGSKPAAPMPWTSRLFSVIR